MKAILLAAGKGTRLAPATEVLPKCLMPINGHPLLEYWLQGLFGAGVSSLLVNTHHHAHLVEEYISRSPFASRVTLVHEPELLGTGGTLAANRDFAEGKPLMVAHADNLSFADFRAFQQAHAGRPDESLMTMMTFLSPTPHTCGIVEPDAFGLVQSFHEKVFDPPSSLANAAVYILEPEIIDYIAAQENTFLDFSTQVLPRFLGKISTWHNDVYHRDIGTPESLLMAQLESPETICTLENDPWPELALPLSESFYQRLSAMYGDFTLTRVLQYENFESLVLRNAGCVDPEKELVYLPQAVSGFSSKVLHQCFNVRSMALCCYIRR